MNSPHTPPRPSLVSQLLRCAMHAEPVPAQTLSDDTVLRWIVLSGLGALACHLLRQSGYAEDQVPDAFRGAELTARLQWRTLSSALASTMDTLRAADVLPAAMKGITFADCYYPAPHLRIMKDVDLLVTVDQREPAEAALLDAGFERGEGMTYERYLDHHHAAPLHHAELQLWIELHSGMLPPNARAAGEAPILFESLEQVCLPSDEVSGFTLRLKPEVEFTLLATAWCRDLGADFGEPGLQRRLFDAIYLMQNEPDLDWEQIVAWSQHTLVGKCVGVLLSYLDRLVALPEAPRQALSDLRNAYLGAVSLRVTHRFLDRYLLADQHRSSWLSNGSLSSVFDALLAPVPPWRSLAALPQNLLFPRQEAERFKLGYQWHRIRSLANRLLSNDSRA